MVDPLYPVLNIPRSASFRIVDNLYDCGDTEIKVSQSCKDGDFAIGDMLEFNGVRGVVFYRSGDVTKIVSVEQGKSCWSTEYIAIDATDKDNGRKNMAVVQAVESWESKYPAFAWCAICACVCVSVLSPRCRVGFFVCDGHHCLPPLERVQLPSSGGGNRTLSCLACDFCLDTSFCCDRTYSQDPGQSAWLS